MPYLRTAQEVELRNRRNLLMNVVRCDHASSEIHTLGTHASTHASSEISEISETLGIHLHGVPASLPPSHLDRDHDGEASLICR